MINTDLENTIKEVIESLPSSFVNGSSGWVYLSSLGHKARVAGIQYREYGSESLLEFIQCFDGLSLYKDKSIFPPVYYVKVSGEVSFVSRSSTCPEAQTNTNIPNLSEWAYLGDCLMIYEDLCQLALDENWGEYEDDNGRIHHPILVNYLNNTFQRLFLENKILQSVKKNYAAFNTGLVDDRYLPIFALFDKNEIPDHQEWHLIDFCIAGENRAGKILNAEFSEMPQVAKYFTSIYDMLYDTTKGEPVLDFEHIILERTDRLPYEFIKKHSPKGFDLLLPEQISSFDENDGDDYYKKLSDAIKKDHECYRSLCHSLSIALSVAIKRVQWNFKSAIPMYYPKRKKMCHFLPLCLVNDKDVDLALVVERTNAGRYQGATIYKLEWAYKCARLVCRPDSDWLTPHVINEDTDD